MPEAQSNSTSIVCNGSYLHALAVETTKSHARTPPQST